MPHGPAKVERAACCHGVYDEPKGVGVDEGNLWGDYFYLEALTRGARPRMDAVLVSALAKKGVP